MVSVQPTVVPTSPTCVTVTGPHRSLATTDPIFGAGTTGLQPGNTTFAGQVIVGGVVSTVLVIVCVQVAELPHTSVARYVLVVVSVQVTVLVTSPTWVIVTGPHKSLAVTDPIFGAGTAGLQPGNTTFAGQVIVGGAVSTVLVIVCVHVAELPQPSVARYVLVVVSVQLTRLVTSLTCVIVTAPHRSLAVTDPIFGAGTAGLHPGNTTFAGQVIIGGAVSSDLEMVCVHVDVLPQPSAA